MKSKLLIATALGCALLARPANGRDYILELIPFAATDLVSGDVYQVSGSITTHKPIRGKGFNESDVLDYSITVDGPVPFTFTPSNPGAAVYLRARLYLDYGVEWYLTVDSAMRFVANGNTSPECDDCWQMIRWDLDELHGDRGYFFIDNADHRPDVRAYASPSFELPPPPTYKRRVVATMPVPEPTTLALACAGVALLSGLRRRHRKA